MRFLSCVESKSTTLESVLRQDSRKHEEQPLSASQGVAGGGILPAEFSLVAHGGRLQARWMQLSALVEKPLKS